LLEGGDKEDMDDNKEGEATSPPLGDIVDGGAGVGGDDSEREGDGPPTPGKRKTPKKKRRGKKKKASANNGGLEDEEGEREREREKGDENNGGEGVTSLVVPSTPKPEGSSSLVVSDTILG
jgi:serine/threonine-protein kinase/endoribonuclease IRE1